MPVDGGRGIEAVDHRDLNGLALLEYDQRARQRDGLRIRSWWLTLAGILAITAVGSTLMLNALPVFLTALRMPEMS